MDGLPALFADLYNRFLLRDFVGKIVPGGVLVFSVLSLIRNPRFVLKYLMELSTPALVFVAGLTWILTLGVQNLFEASGLWAYFPYKGAIVTSWMSERTLLTNSYGIPEPADFGEATEQILRFQATAAEGQKLQYERFVVIKEASGNLFAAIVLSVPAWCLQLVRSGNPRRWTLAVYLVLLGAGISFGLFRMHWQHVGRQWTYATNITAAARSETAPPPECTQKVRARLSERGYGAVAIDDICKR